MAQEQGKQQQQFENQFRELPRFTLWTDAPGIDPADKTIKFKRSRLSWSSFMGNPRITVYTNVPEDTKDKGMIRAPMDLTTFKMFKQQAEFVMKSEPGTKVTIENYTKDRDADGNYGEKYKLSETIIGKDKKGQIVISVQSPDRPVIYFGFAVSDFHKIVKGNGEAFTLAESSVTKARADLDALEDIFTIHAKEQADKDAAAPREKAGGNGNSKFKKPEKKDDFSDLDDVTF